jgi:hypothetical protein
MYKACSSKFAVICVADRAMMGLRVCGARRERLHVSAVTVHHPKYSFDRSETADGGTPLKRS